MPDVHPPPSTSTGPADPLRALLRALAEETGSLVAAADGLQGLVGELMADPPLRPPDAMARAQALDALVQQLQGMEAFLVRLGGAALEDLAADAADAASAMSLSAQSRRFDMGSRSPQACTLVGEFDLF